MVKKQWNAMKTSKKITLMVACVAVFTTVNQYRVISHNSLYFLSEIDSNEFDSQEDDDLYTASFDVNNDGVEVIHTE